MNELIKEILDHAAEVERRKPPLPGTADLLRRAAAELGRLQAGPRPAGDGEAL